MSLYRILLNGLVLIVGIYFTALMTVLTLPYSTFQYDVAFLLSKQNVLHVLAWRYSFYIHIFFSLPVLLFGFLQINQFLLRRSLLLHRFIGRIYAYIVLLLSAPSGLIMALYANGGILAQISFILIACLWWYFTFKGVQQAKQKNILSHRAFMYRSFALTLSAITLRTYVFLLPQFIQLNGKDLYILVAWLSWVPNLLLAELLIYLRRTTTVLY